MTKASREFEQLVAHIESVLGPTGAVITSPDHLLDRITGGTREVDASIRVTIGSVPLLITVECRDRADSEDVTWIEQLASKRDHVGAAHTIAVSSRGFSQPAISAARAHGISTRVVSDITDATILAWVDQLEVQEVTTRIALDSLRLVYEGEHADATMADLTRSLYDQRGWDAPIFRDLSTGRTSSLAELVERAANPRRLSASPGSSVQVIIPPQGTFHFSNDPLAILVQDEPLTASDQSTGERVIEFIDENYVVDTRSGPLRLQQVAFAYTLSNVRRTLGAKRAVSYSGDARRLADVVERELALDDGRRLLVIHHRRVDVSK